MFGNDEVDTHNLFLWLGLFCPEFLIRQAPGTCPFPQENHMENRLQVLHTLLFLLTAVVQLNSAFYNDTTVNKRRLIPPWTRLFAPSHDLLLVNLWTLGIY